MLALIKQKQTGQTAHPAKAAPSPAKVVDLMTALKRSLAKGEGKTAATSEEKKKLSKPGTAKRRRTAA